MPPGGFAYRHGPLGFDVRPGTALALQGLEAVTEAFQQAVLNNPDLGLNPGWEECKQAVLAYNYTRFGVTEVGQYFRVIGDVVVEAEEVPDASRAVKRRASGCRSCGGRR